MRNVSAVECGCGCSFHSIHTNQRFIVGQGRSLTQLAAWAGASPAPPSTLRDCPKQSWSSPATTRCDSADALSPSILKKLLKGEGGGAVIAGDDNKMIAPGEAAASGGGLARPIRVAAARWPTQPVRECGAQGGGRTYYAGQPWWEGLIVWERVAACRGT